MNRRGLSYVLAFVAGALVIPAPAMAEEQALTGSWHGTYAYRAEEGRDPVDFTMIVIQEGKRLSGLLREKNTFGDPQEPWLHAAFQGDFDATSRTIKFVKTYDGTAGVKHEVRYSGRISSDRTQIVAGRWEIPESIDGTFTLNKDLNSQAGRWTGYWHGTQRFAPGRSKQPVRFSMYLVQQGNELFGISSERATQEVATAPWLHAIVTGRLREGERQMVFSKKYDGTGGRRDSVEYRAQLRGENTGAVKGTWGEGEAGGEFEIERALSAE